MAIDTKNYPDTFAALMDEFSPEVEGLMSRLEQGDISASEWQDEMKDMQARYAMAARMLGNGNNDLSEGDKAATQLWLNDQYKYLEGFASVISAAGGDYNPAWLPRAEMYGTATAIEYWEGATEGLPLPAQPAQGTQCLSNCRCSWRIEWIDKENGDADCYWEFGDADHCQTCEVRHEMWYPIRIRGGDLGEPLSPAGTNPEVPPPTSPITDHVFMAKTWTTASEDGAMYAQKAISEVHKVPSKIATVRIREGTPEQMGKNVQGDYNIDTNLIRIGANVRFPTTATTHELGHWLDREDLGSGSNKFSSERRTGTSPSAKAFKKWHQAIEASPSYKKLARMRESQQLTMRSGTTVPLSKSQQAFVDYLLQDRELFARSYAQYISVRAKDQQIQNEIYVEYHDLTQHTYPQIWAPEEFVAIADSMDDIFRANGLLNE